MYLSQLIYYTLGIHWIYATRGNLWESGNKGLYSRYQQTQKIFSRPFFAKNDEFAGYEYGNDIRLIILQQLDLNMQTTQFLLFNDLLRLFCHYYFSAVLQKKSLDTQGTQIHKSMHNISILYPFPSCSLKGSNLP